MLEAAVEENSLLLVNETERHARNDLSRNIVDVEAVVGSHQGHETRNPCMNKRILQAAGEGRNQHLLLSSGRQRRGNLPKQDARIGAYRGLGICLRFGQMPK